MICKELLALTKLLLVLDLGHVLNAKTESLDLSCPSVHLWTESYPICIFHNNYRKTSSISRTKSQNLNVSHLILQLSLPNPLKPNVKLRMKM